MGELALGHVREVSHILLGAGGTDAGESFLIGGTEDVEDLVELVDVVTALEEGAATEELCENAAHGPYINLEELATVIYDG